MFLKLYRAVLIAFSLFLVGCNAHQESLNAFIQQSESQAKAKVGALSPDRSFQVREYQGREERSPFILPEVFATAEKERLENCWQPNLRQKKGQLESYSLTALKLKGVMGNGQSLTGLIQTPKGNVVKVNSGQYLGQNHGRIMEVKAQYLEVQETFSDGLGCWHQRSTKLALK